jgi:hypothetical protein
LRQGERNARPAAFLENGWSDEMAAGVTDTGRSRDGEAQVRPATGAASLLRAGRAWIGAHGDRIFPLVAAGLLVVSILFPYWRLKLHAPQYPRGLEARVTVRTFEGDIREINGLNHYIGMRPLEEGGELERNLSIFAIPAMAGLAALMAVRRRWMWLLAVPAIAYPVVFTADLFYWLHNFGHNLDPTAALSASIGEFTPTILGPGKVGQFRTTSFYDIGFAMALLAALLLIVAVVVRIRRERAES